MIQPDEDLSWKLRGNCKDEDPELFFSGDERIRQEESPEERLAKKICQGCPVSGDCLDAALENSEYGVWGGTTWHDRKSLTRKGSRRTCIRCGGRDHARTGTGQVCVRCGLSWLV